MTKINNKDLIAEAMEDSNFWNVHDELKGLSIDQLQEIQKKESFPFAVCVLNLTGDLNTGMIARTACIHGAQEFIVFGRICTIIVCVCISKKSNKCYWRIIS